MRRFLLHVLPRGFVKIRHYGLLANRRRGEKLAAARWLLGVARVVAVAKTAAGSPVERRCPPCCCGRLVVVEELPRVSAPQCAGGCDSS